MRSPLVAPEHRRELRRAEEALAPAHERAGAAAQAVEIGGPDRAAHRVGDLAAGHALAEADDLAVIGALGPPVGARERLAEVRHAQRRQLVVRPGAELEAGGAEPLAHV